MNQNQETGTVLNGEVLSEKKNAGTIKEENILAGIVGAFLFSLVGGILWYVLYQIGFIAAISGIVAVICAIKGYSFFSKRESVKGIIISSVIAFFVIVLAWYACLANDVFLAYKEWYQAGDIDYEVTFFEAVKGAYLFLEEPDIALAYLTDLGIGVLFCILGCVQPIRTALRRAKQSS